MFVRRSTTNSLTTSRTVSRANSIVDHPTNEDVLQAAIPVNSRRTLLADEDDDTDTDLAQSRVWSSLKETGPVSPVSEADPSLEEVKTLQVSNLSKGVTMASIYEAFRSNKSQMRIEFKSSDCALLHFHDAETAMKAYFTYLQSTNSIGTVSPYEASIPTTTTTTTHQKVVPKMLNWRSSSERSVSSNTNGEEKRFRPSHRTSSSKSSISSKHGSRNGEKVPSPSISPAEPVVAVAEQVKSKESRTGTAARRIFSGGLGLKFTRRDKTEDMKT